MKKLGHNIQVNLQQAVPETKAPTLAEKFAQVDAEAAKMAQEEAEVLAKMGISL